MKKLLALLMAMIMLLSFAACGGDNQEEGKTNAPAESQTIDYANMTEDTLIQTFIKDQANITVDEYVALVSTLSYVKITDDLKLEENITQKAIKKLKENKAKTPASADYIPQLIKHEAPQVRGYGMSLVSSFLGVSDANSALIKEVLKTEKEPYVLNSAVNALANEGGKDPEIGKFLVDMAKHENSIIRKSAASALGSSWNKGVDGAVDTIITLMSDSDDDVRKAAYRYSGKLADERVIEPIVKMLKNPAEAKFHADGVEGLLTLWYDYPLHGNTSEAAYKATLDYYKTKPASNDIPAWQSFTSLTHKADSKYGEWLEKATYFNTDELAKIMTDIIKDANANQLARTGALKVIAAQCSEDVFDDLEDVIEGLTDNKASAIKMAYETQKKSMD